MHLLCMFYILRATKRWWDMTFDLFISNYSAISTKLCDPLNDVFKHSEISCLKVLQAFKARAKTWSSRSDAANFLNSSRCQQKNVKFRRS